MANTLVLKNDRDPEFQVCSRTVKNPYKFMFAIDFGTAPGHWLMIILNHTAYGFGYLPRKGVAVAKKTHHAVGAVRRPSPV